VAENELRGDKNRTWTGCWCQ